VQPAKTQRPFRRPCHLFLSSSGLISLLPSSLLTLANQSSFTSRIPQLSVRTSLDSLGQIALLDLADLGSGVDDGKTVLDARNNVLDILNILLGSITGLVFAEFAGEEDETGLVSL
jgi:hypothetical protein